MKHQFKTTEQIIPPLRVLVAQALVSEYGYKKKQAAEAIGVTPSAITQYFKGKRGQDAEQLSALKDVQLVVANLAERISKRKDIESGFPEIVQAAHHIMSLIKGVTTLGIAGTSVRVPKAAKGEMRVLRERLEEEVQAARKNLEVANSVKDDFVELLFRQIATDSMRHADIISLVMAKLESGENVKFDPPSIGLLKNLIASEDGSSGQHLNQHVDARHPALDALLESVDADEGKHVRMLRRLLEAIIPAERA